MISSRWIAGAAALLLAGALAPLGGAVDIGCMESRDGVASTYIPIQGQTTSFTPNCLIIANGETVTWTNLDGQDHDPTLWGCVDPGLLEPASVLTATLRWDADAQTLYATEPGREEVACSMFGPEGEEIVRVEEGRVVETFFCQIHPLSMIGRVEIST